jgi:catechol 2,3-dioxygenase-like lactoylglutathione lyase family enzyme
MSILGVESVIFGAEDFDRSVSFFSDFGLPMHSSSPDSATFQLETGSKVIIRRATDASLPKSHYVGSGVRETIWGVDSAASLEALVKGLSADRKVTRDEDGTAHFFADDGMALGLRVWQKHQPLSAPDSLNSPGNITRLNRHRTWRKRAIPKMINHVVFASPNYVESFKFFRDRLNFRLSDHSKGLGAFARADGASEHHNIFWLNAHQRGGGKPGFEHVAFAVEDIDELMVGANHMTRKGWSQGALSGLSRHRIASAIFYYLDCPAGGQAEYLADTDCLDDRWIPRVWSPNFGVIAWATTLPPWLMQEPEWDVAFDPDGASLNEMTFPSK